MGGLGIAGRTGLAAVHVTPILLLIPLGGIAAGVIALRRFAVNPIHFGRGAALVGLLLSVIFLTAPLSRNLVADGLVRNQPRDLAEKFFEYLREDQPEKSALLKISAELRPPLDADVWNFYRHDRDARIMLTRFVANPYVRTLLALGPRADIRFYKVKGTVNDGSRALVSYWYTVTFENEQQQKETFIALIVLERRPSAPEVNPWRVVDMIAGINPETGLP